MLLEIKKKRLTNEQNQYKMFDVMSNKSNKVLVQYIRNKNSEYKGVVVATLVPTHTDIGEVIRVGWSLCNKRDTFCKKIGKKIALGRAYDNTLAKRFSSNMCFYQSFPVPPTAVNTLKDMLVRARKYFKNKMYESETIVAEKHLYIQKYFQ